ncbi:hypothetical protein CEP54_014990 [Fusarium duplospermum]|uniref:transketolase n=1 Tax=Fusarium duplospermum TaxID=1325734 RepID=A0A428NSA7_9HYPO|nr:hypothetical protein CEP54_014990 [Fusarium duplospermum]
MFAKYATEYPAEHAVLSRRLAGDLPKDWEKSLPTFSPSDSPMATRKISELILGKLESVIPDLFGGSADVTPSNLTRWNGAVDFQASTLGDYSGRYVRYGVREHAMGTIMNGLAAYGTVIPYAGTFLNFVSYAAGAVRLSALSRFRTIWIATHDSIGLREDGPTHQPIETLSHFRALPNLMVWRPADGNETSAAYLMAVESRTTPSIIALCRQNVPHFEGSSVEKACKGGYTLKEVDRADITIVSSGSEVSLHFVFSIIMETKDKSKTVNEAPNVMEDHNSLSNRLRASEAAQREAQMPLLQCLKLYHKAVAFSIIISACIIMEGYDVNLLQGLFAFEPFQRRYGEEQPDGSYQLSAQWQAGLANGVAVGEILGLFINGIVSERIGYRRTVLWSLFFVTCFIFILFFAPGVEVLLVGEILCGIPWGVFQTLTTVYAAEVCPVQLRAYLTTYVNLCWVMGTLLGQGILRAFVESGSSEWAYRIPFAIQ